MAPLSIFVHDSVHVTDDRRVLYTDRYWEKKLSFSVWIVINSYFRLFFQST